MLTALDLLIIVAMAMAAACLLVVVLMFLVRNKIFRRVCLYILAVLGLYLGYVGFRINFPDFMPQVLLAVLMALTAVGAFVLERFSKDSKAKFLIARIMAALSVTVGFFNAFS